MADNFISRFHTSEAVIQVVSNFTKLAESDIALLDFDADQFPEKELFISADYWEGNFTTRLVMYEKPGSVDEIDFALYLADRFNEDILISHWANNPFLWILVEPNGKLYRVTEEPLDKEMYLMINKDDKFELDLDIVRMEMRQFS